MPRYEFTEGTSSKFWEITLDGESYTTTYGKIGSAGKATTKELASAAAAQKAYDKAINSKVKKGYELVTDGAAEESVEPSKSAPPPTQATKSSPPDPAAEARFIAMLQQNPSDIETYLDYAGWLQANGHPRGDLIAVQDKLRKDPNNKSARKAEKQLLEQHSEVFFGPFAPDLSGEMVEAEWFMGFITTAKVQTTYENDPEFAGSSGNPIDVYLILQAFLDHPSTAFIQSLTLGILTIQDNDYDLACEIISERSLPTLQSIFIGDFDHEETELNWSSATSAGIYKSCPDLRSLIVRSGGLRFGEIHAPELREFEAITGELDGVALTQICSAYWPKLERLSIMFGPQGLSKVELVQDILDAKNIPSVNQLAIANAEFTHAFIEKLPGSKVLPQLDELDLRMGTMADESAHFIFDNKEAFAHLTALNVDDNFLTDAGIALLQKVVPYVYAGEQRLEDPEDRYASMYE